MKIGERGQVTIPKPLRERHGMAAGDEVEFVEVNGELVVRKAAREAPRRLAAWVGYLEGQPADVDEFIEDIRGR